MHRSNILRAYFKIKKLIGFETILKNHITILNSTMQIYRDYFIILSKKE